jgi:leader peptidase (prepilin peptidase) / N-methyltransferase
MTFETLLALLLAPLIGSFLGVVVERLPEGRPLMLARSTCPACGEVLHAQDLVPLLSWTWRRGWCRCGRFRLGAFYPAIEIAALAVAASAVLVLSGWLLWVSLALGWTLLTLAAIDLRHYLLPDRLTLPLIPAGLATAYLIDPARLPVHAIGAAAGFVAFAGIAWAYRRVRRRAGLGLGDAKLLAGAGAWLGWPALPGLVVAAAVGALAVALAHAALGERLAAATRIAFGPYLALALWLFWLYGPLLLGQPEGLQPSY